MPVTMESRQPSVARAHIERMERFVNLHPAMSRSISRFDLVLSNDCPYRMGWARENNIDNKKYLYNAEVVTVEMAKKYIAVGLKEDDYDKANNRIVKSGMTLMCYTHEAYELREMLPLMAAIRAMDGEIKGFNSTDGARILDATGKPSRPGMVRKKAHPTQDDVIADKLNALDRRSSSSDGAKMPRIIGEGASASDEE